MIIDGVVAEVARKRKPKPKCLYCGRELRPNYDTVCTQCGVDAYKHGFAEGRARDGACQKTYDQVGKDGRKILKGWGRRNDGYFCSDRHGIWFAEAAADAGYRLVKEKK
jgi:hypothetical protein